MEAVWRDVQTLAVYYAGRVIGAFIILVAGWVGIRLLIGPLGRLVPRTRIDPSVASFLTNSTRYGLLAVIILGVLQQLGVETASLLTLLGAAGVAVALSLQGSLANFASGLLVLSFRMVRVGDLVELGDVRGRVAEMLPFYIVIVAADNQRITVPNTLLTNGAVRNNTALPSRRVQWILAVPPGKDLGEVRARLLARVREDPRVLKDPEPQAYVQEWAVDKRGVMVTAWTATADYVSVQQDLLEVLGASVEAVERKAG